MLHRWPATERDHQMNEEQIRKLLVEVSEGKTPIEDAVSSLRDMPFEDLGHARVDHHRNLRCGFPEVIYCQGKDPADLTEIAASILSHLSLIHI